MGRKRSEIVTIRMRPQDEPVLQRAREDISICLDPLTLGGLLEAVMIQCQERPVLTDQMKKRMRELAENNTYHRDFRNSSMSLDSRVCAWLLRETPDSSLLKSSNDFIRWIAEDWDMIRDYFPTRPAALTKRLQSLDDVYPLPKET